MKTLKMTLALLTLVITVSLQSQTTIPNQDFEAWISATAPKNWQTTTQMLPPGNITCQRTTNSQTGDYAIELTTIDLGGWAVPGVITLGELGIGYTAGGIAFTDKPISLKGYVKHASAGDQIMVAIQFYKDGSEIGGGFWSTMDSIPDFQEFTVPITFSTSLNPDTMNITILTDQNIPGSTMIIDGLHFEYTTTNSDDKSENPKFSVYPNPCSDQLIMSLPEGEDFEASVYDLNGATRIGPASLRSRNIDVSGIAPGTYVLVVNSAENVYRRTFIKR